MIGRSVVKGTVSVALLGAASFFTCITATHAATPAASSSAHNSLLSVRAALLSAINQDRAAHGLRALTIDKKQSTCSVQHSASMAQANSLFHSDLSTDTCSSHFLVGQNVGMASGSPSAAALTVHQIMMNEGPCPQKGCPGNEFEQHGHYVNILNPSAHHVGIGLVVQGGALWLTEDFTA
jgi:uncharacterized protein YkwD